MAMRSQLAFRPKCFTCSICNEAIELETAKIDATGNQCMKNATCKNRWQHEGQVAQQHADTSR